MTFWLIVLLALFLVWLALAPRQGQRVVRVSQGFLSRISFFNRGPSISPERVRVVVLDATHASNPTSGSTSASELENFSDWLDGLDGKELSAFAKQLNNSLQADKVSLSWATNGGTGGSTQRALQEVILFHALAIWRARALTALAHLQAYLANPNARGNRAFAQKVYARLAHADPSIIDPNLMMASEGERSKYVHAAIEKSAHENMDKVVNIVRDVTNESKAKVKTPTPASPAPVETQALPPATRSEG